MFNSTTWKDGEKQAQDYLLDCGYKVLEANSKLVGAEVDIIAIDTKKNKIRELKNQLKKGAIIKESYRAAKKNISDELVFVEVKARASYKYGLPQESITNKKQQHIKRFAQAYILKHNIEFPIRFDCIAITNGNLEHIKNAF